MSQWYLYENEEVVGPFEPHQLGERIDEGTLVCRAGEEEWQEAGEVSELASVLETESVTARQPDASVTAGEPSEDGESEEELEIIEPTLENFVEICEEASDQSLLEEYDSHFDEYDNREKYILKNELERRSLLQET